MFLELCRRIAAFSDVAGEITRTFLSPATREVQALLRREWEVLGMTVRVDSAGNLRGLLPGAGEDAPVLLMGSHLDTVPNAGAYDGLLGIAVATAVVGRLGGRRLPFAVELIAFSEEEGIRFGLPFIGSRALVGDLGAAELARRDADGVTVAEAIREFGLDPEGLGDARMTAHTFAFLEVHMEQGPVLESLGVPLGVVTAIVGQSRYELTWTGQANHAGTTPMHLRRDALGGAAEFVTAVENYARGAEGLVATVGSLRVAPGAVNVVRGRWSCRSMYGMGRMRFAWPRRRSCWGWRSGLRARGGLRWACGRPVSRPRWRWMRACGVG